MVCRRHTATTGGTESCKPLLPACCSNWPGPLSSLSISAHSCPVEHPNLELLSGIYGHVCLFVCFFLHHFHKLQSKWYNFPLVLWYLYESTHIYAQLEIQTNATSGGDSESEGLGIKLMLQREEGIRCHLVTAAQQPRGNAEGFSGGAGRREAPKHVFIFASGESEWDHSGVAATDVRSKHFVNIQKISMTGRCQPLKDHIWQNGPGAGGQLQMIVFAPWGVSSVQSQEVHLGLAAIWSWWIVAEP